MRNKRFYFIPSFKDRYLNGMSLYLNNNISYITIPHFKSTTHIIFICTMQCKNKKGVKRNVIEQSVVLLENIQFDFVCVYKYIYKRCIISNEDYIQKNFILFLHIFFFLLFKEKKILEIFARKNIYSNNTNILALLTCAYM